MTSNFGNIQMIALGGPSSVQCCCCLLCVLNIYISCGMARCFSIFINPDKQCKLLGLPTEMTTRGQIVSRGGEWGVVQSSLRTDVVGKTEFDVADSCAVRAVGLQFRVFFTRQLVDERPSADDDNVVVAYVAHLLPSARNVAR